MFLKWMFLVTAGLCFGLLASAGVFTVLVSVGLIPRFAGKTHTSRKVFLYEEMVVLGTVVGGIVSIFEEQLKLGEWVLSTQWLSETAWQSAGNIALACFGIFAGMFVGCLALAIAEMLNSIPILARRIGFRHGLGVAILAVALGKLCGSLLYFFLEIK